MSNLELRKILHRIAELLEKIYPSPETRVDFAKARAFVWDAEQKRFTPVNKVNCIPIELLKGINQSRDLLVENTKQFARGFPANNALLITDNPENVTPDPILSLIRPFESSKSPFGWCAGLGIMTRCA